MVITISNRHQDSGYPENVGLDDFAFAWLYKLISQGYIQRHPSPKVYEVLSLVALSLNCLHIHLILA